MLVPPRGVGAPSSRKSWILHYRRFPNTQLIGHSFNVFWSKNAVSFRVQFRPSFFGNNTFITARQRSCRKVIFSRVCLSHDTAPLPIQGPNPSLHRAPAPFPVQGPGTPLPGADIWWLAIEDHMVGERVVRILLECFLVIYDFYFSLLHVLSQVGRKIYFFASSNKIFRRGRQAFLCD